MKEYVPDYNGASTHFGYFRGGFCEGYGEQRTVDDECFYEGHFLDDVRDGIGRLTNRKTRAVYLGEFRRSLKHGFGTFKDSNTTYVGFWASDKREGIGIATSIDGKQYYGQWLDGYRQGVGQETTRDFCYYGEWLNDKPHGRGVLKSFKTGQSRSVIFEEGVLSREETYPNRYHSLGSSKSEEEQFKNTCSIRVKQFENHLGSEAASLKERFNGLNLSSISRAERDCLAEISAIQNRFFTLQKVWDDKMKKLHQLLVANGLGINQHSSADNGLGSFGGPAHSAGHASKSDSHRTSAYDKYIGDYITGMEPGNRRFSDLNVGHGLTNSPGKSPPNDIMQSAVFAGQEVAINRDRSFTEPKFTPHRKITQEGDMAGQYSDEFWKQKLLALDFSRRGAENDLEVPAPSNTLPPKNEKMQNSSKINTTLSLSKVESPHKQADLSSKDTSKSKLRPAAMTRNPTNPQVDQLALEAYLFAFNGDIDEKIMIKDSSSASPSRPKDKESSRDDRFASPDRNTDNAMSSKAQVLKSNRRRTPDSSVSGSRYKGGQDQTQHSRDISPHVPEPSYREDYQDQELDFGGRQTPLPPRSKNVSMVIDAERSQVMKLSGVNTSGLGNQGRSSSHPRFGAGNHPFLDELERMTEEISKIEVPEDDHDTEPKFNDQPRDYYSRPVDQTVSQDLSVLGLREYLNDNDQRPVGYLHPQKWNNDSNFDVSLSGEKTLLKVPRSKSRSRPKKHKPRRDVTSSMKTEAFRIDVRDADDNTDTREHRAPDTTDLRNPTGADDDRSLVTKGDFLRKKKKSPVSQVIGAKMPV